MNKQKLVLSLLKYLKKTMFIIGLSLLSCYSSAATLKEINTLSREEYVKQLRALMKKEACNNNESVFKKCFTISEKQCLDTIQSAFKDCVNYKIKVAQSVDISTEGAEYSKKIGRCVGEKFYIKNQKNLSSMSSCKERQTWL